MLNKKKGQLLSQPFIYIFMLVVIGLLLFFGFRVIKNFMSVTKDVEFVKFVNDFEDEIELYYDLDIGSSKIIDAPVGNEIMYTCFVDRDGKIDYSIAPDKRAGDLMRAAIGKNVFFISYPTLKEREAVYIKHIRPEGKNPLCIRTINKLKVKIESKGKYVGISRVK